MKSKDLEMGSSIKGQRIKCQKISEHLMNSGISFKYVPFSILIEPGERQCFGDEEMFLLASICKEYDFSFILSTTGLKIYWH